MVQSSETQQLLAPFLDEEYFQKQVRRLAALPSDLNQLGLVLIGARKRDEKIDYEQQQRRLFQALKDLTGLPPSDRQRLFAALAPAICHEIEAAWQVFDRLPYLSGASRRPFRLSGGSGPLESGLARCAWVSRLLQVIKGYDQPVTWFAAWAASLGWSAPDILGILFAGAIDRGDSTGQEVFDILTASAQGDHPTGKMGRHVIRALLCAARPDGWTFIERLLLAAQREEGLRQVILEAVDEAHPDAFLRILRLVLDQNLIRFSAVVRAAAVWVGLPFESASPKIVLAVLTKLQNFLAQPDTCRSVLTDGAPEDQYLALWSIAYRDTARAISAAQPLLQHPGPDHRFAAVYFLSQTHLAEGQSLLLTMIDDDDLRVAVYAWAGLAADRADSGWGTESDLFERLERLVQRLPERTKSFDPIVWDWMALQVDRKSISDALVAALGSRPPARLLPYLKGMNPHARLSAARLFQQHAGEDPKYREVLFDLAADRDSYVHENVLPLLEKLELHPDEIPRLEALLTRKTSSLRRGVIGLLLRHPDPGLLASIDRLLAQKDEQQRLAGIELLRDLAKAGRVRTECQARIARLQSGKLSDVEKLILADLLSEKAVNDTLEDALGLADLRRLSQPIEPRPKTALFGLVKNVRLGSAAAAACIQALDDLIDQHRAEAVEVNDWRNEARTELLGNAHGRLPTPDPGLSIEENRRRLPLAETWGRWWQERPDSLRDRDGLELLRAQAALCLLTQQWVAAGEWTQIVPKELRAYLDEPYDFHLKYQEIVAALLTWLEYLHPAPDSVSFLLNAVEEICSRTGQHLVKGSPSYGSDRWEISPNRLGYLRLARQHRHLHRADWTNADQARLWGLLRWLQKFTWKEGGVYRLEMEDVLQAVKIGAASEDDLFLFLLGGPGGSAGAARSVGPGGQARINFTPQHFHFLRQFTGKRPHPFFTEYLFLQSAVERCRDRIIDVELRRGDLPTPASAPALALRSVPGAVHGVRLLAALGKADFDRSSGYSSDQSRSSVLSHLLRVSYPLESDSSEVFGEYVRAAGIPDKRLVELAVFAPQWAAFVQDTLGWNGMVEGVWWVYAHTRDRQWSVGAEIRESWSAQIAEYTPLSADALLDGAVDVDWFQRMYAVLGEERWQEIYRVALYAASGSGHARARLFADALLGKLSSGELIERIEAKRNQDAVRALGLVPLPDGASRQIEILRRYEVMQAFLRTSKQFGSQRQASEKLAAGIGMENLARTAGYQDPQRLEWAMELATVADLANGPVSAQADGITVTLSVDDLGEAELTFQRGEKILKNLPAAVKNEAGIAALVARKQTLEQQARRMRVSLEAAMNRGDLFRAGEIQGLLGHPILRVMLEQLIFVAPAGMGYSVAGGEALEGLGRQISLNPEDPVRIAHPYDLLQSGCWHDWQHECFIAERIQPFKQVFRELYVLTQTEQDEKNFSRRYAGQQVQPRQALALLGGRGWVTAPEEGVFKTFHSEGLVARVSFLQAFFTPAEVEGLTLETVGFTRRGEWLPVKLDQVPARLFSEVMRDLDLVVSVAHAGGIDPEASASSIEARAALVQETCALLKLTNVRVENRHALVDGKLGNYSIHLGSGTVHKQPGGALCIIPVHAQHRGRLFLPFADDDPKSAEVVSKVLLLAKDREIKDPTILEQILR